VLYSRNDRDISRSYPEAAGLVLEAGLVVDGELVAVDGRGRPDFGLLQQRMHVAKPAAELIVRVPVQYVVFDVLRRASRSLLSMPYQERRAELAALSLSERGVVVPDSFTDTPGEVVMPPKSNTASSRPSTIAGAKPSPTALTNPRNVAEQGSTPEGR
jgi:bifunctional non-homologous end joining protein LigD